MTKPWEETWEALGPHVGTADEEILRSTTEHEPTAWARARLAAAAPDMVRVLLEMEWKPLGTCPGCGGLGEAIPDNPMTGPVAATGHRPDCALDAALRKAGVR